MPQSMTAADVLAKYGTPANASSSDVPAPAGMSAGDVLTRYGGTAASAAASAPTFAQKAAAYGKELEAEGNALSAGITHGATTLFNAPARVVTNALTKIGGMSAIRNGLTDIGMSPTTANNLFPDGASTVNGVTSNPLADQQAAQQQAYQAQYGNNPNATVGNFVGQNLVTLPALGVGAGALRAGGMALSNGLVDSAPAVAKGVQYGTNFLSGAAGAGKAGKLALAERTASRAAGSAVAGAAYNGATGAPVGEGAVAGAALGPAGGAVGDVAKVAASKISPLLDPETRALAAKAEQFGIKLRGPQITDSSFVRYADSSLRNLPAMGYEKTDAAVQQQFNHAVAAQMGATSDKITPTVMADTKARLGQTYDDIVPNLSIKPSDDLLEKLGSIESEAKNVLPDQEIGPVQKQIGNVLNGFKEGQDMPGAYLHNMIKKGAPLDRMMQSSDPNVSHYASQIRQTLNDAMQANASPEVAKKLAETNAQYKAMKTIEPLVEKSTTGDMSPALLMSQVRKSYGGMAYNGGGDMGDLARIGQRFLKEPPNSGTAPRNMIYHALGTMGGLGAVAVSPEVGLSHLAAAGGLGGMVAAGRGLKSALDSQAYYNSLMGRPGAPVTNWLLQR